MNLHRFCKTLLFSLVLALPFVIMRDAVAQQVQQWYAEPVVQELCANLMP